MLVLVNVNLFPIIITFNSVIININIRINSSILFWKNIT
jgi:hypothetical protein